MTFPAQAMQSGMADEADRDAAALAASLTTIGYAMFALLQEGPLPDAQVQVAAYASDVNVSISPETHQPASLYTPNVGPPSATDNIPASATNDRLLLIPSAIGVAGMAPVADAFSLPPTDGPMNAPVVPARDQENISAKEMQEMLRDLSSLEFD